MKYTGFHRAVRFLFLDYKRRWPIAFAREVVVEQIDELRRHAEAAGKRKPSITACVTRAIGMGVAELKDEYPELNATISRFLGWRWIAEFDGVCAGVAVSRQDEGKDWAFPTMIHDPQAKSLDDVTGALQHAATAPAEQIPDIAKFKNICKLPGFIQRLLFYIGVTNPSYHRDYRGTFSLTTVGKFGVDIQMGMPLSTPIQFGFGQIRERPVVRDGQVAAARTMYLTVAFDRCLMNGKPVAALLERTSEILETADHGRWLREYDGPAEATASSASARSADGSGSSGEGDGGTSASQASAA